jgi:hypothetical protein
MKLTYKTILILFTILFGPGLNKGWAQEEKWNQYVNKYEISIDLQHFFSDGIPNKVMFKVNNINERQIKGAYRFGLGSSYWIDKYKITHDNENYKLTADKHHVDISLSFGYEFQKKLNKAVFFYGADLGAYLGITDDRDIPNINEYYNMFFVPFAGVKVFLTQNLSMAFESGIKNYYQWWKGEGSVGSPDNRQYHSFYQSKLELPYSLTFNFNF